MALNDLYKVTFHQHAAGSGQKILNVFWYEQTVGSGGADKLHEAFEGVVRPGFQALQSNEIFYDKLEYINLDDLTDFHTEVYDLTQHGNITGGDIADFLAFGFRLERATRALRHGYKRVAGVLEEHVDNEAVASAYTATVASLATKLGQDIQDVALANTWSPRIVRVTRTNPGVLPAQYSYTSGAIAGVTFYGFTTQNTRKR